MQQERNERWIGKMRAEQTISIQEVSTKKQERIILIRTTNRQLSQGMRKLANAKPNSP